MATTTATVQVDIEEILKVLDDATLTDELERRGHQIDRGLDDYDDEDLIRSLNSRGHIVVATEPDVMAIYEAMHIGAPDAMEKIVRYVELATGRII